MLPNPHDNSYFKDPSLISRSLPAPKKVDIQQAPASKPLPQLDVDAAEATKKRMERREKWLVARARGRMVRNLKRHQKPAPQERHQFSQAKLTTAARDGRLTSSAVRLLDIISALQGLQGFVQTTYASLESELGRCRRQVINLINELVQYGYIQKVIRCTERGMHTGIALVLTDKVMTALKFGEWMKTYGVQWVKYSLQMAVRCGVKCVSPIKGNYQYSNTFLKEAG